MRIEVGKYYKTRDGRKVGPAETIFGGDTFPFNVPHEGHFHGYTSEGKSCIDWDKEDIVAEWVDGEVGTLKELGVKVGDVVECVQWLGSRYSTGDIRTIKKEWECGSVAGLWKIASRAPDTSKSHRCAECDCYLGGSDCNWIAVAATEDTPKTWGDYTATEKGALLLAEYEGEDIEVCVPVCDHTGAVTHHEWRPDYGPIVCKYAYRIKPEPVVETVTLHGRKYVTQVHPTGVWDLDRNDKRPDDTHRITFNTIDGVPDCGSIKMEEV